MNVVLNMVVIAASVLGSGMAFPQARRLVRTRRTDGVSPVWVGVSVALNGWWLAYGALADVWVLVPVSLVSVVLYGTIAVTLVATAGPRTLPGLVAGLLGLGSVPMPFLVAGGWSTAGLAVGLGYGMQLLPAVVGALRTRQLAGIAPGTWLIAWTEALLWLVYGAAVGDAALLAGGTSGVAMASVILGRLAVTGHEPFRAVRPGRLVPAR